eukprot:Platyproteum_vivax@DN7415_c0_g1_i4.p1
MESDSPQETPQIDSPPNSSAQNEPVVITIPKCAVSDNEQRRFVREVLVFSLRAPDCPSDYEAFKSRFGVMNSQWVARNTSSFNEFEAYRMANRDFKDLVEVMRLHLASRPEPPAAPRLRPMRPPPVHIEPIVPLRLDVPLYERPSPPNPKIIGSETRGI